MSSLSVVPSEYAEIMLKYRDKIRLTFISHPLDYHKFALAGARATDCIARSRTSLSVSSQSELRRWIDILFEKQDSLGIKSWGSFASEAGVTDSTRIAQCARGIDSSAAPLIRNFEDWANKVGVRGTPTIVVDGLVLAEPPSRATLDSLVVRRLSNE